jgi:hypothetical protein
LKRAIGQHITPLEVLPPLDEEGQLILIPEEILEVREKKLGVKGSCKATRYIEGELWQYPYHILLALPPWLEL